MVVNDIMFLILVSTCLLLVYRGTINFLYVIPSTSVAFSDTTMAGTRGRGIGVLHHSITEVEG